MTAVDLEPEIAGRDPRDPVLTEAEAEALGARVMAAAADAAKHEAAFLELVGEFDARDAVGWWHGLRSTAHWLSWACSITMGTAREHVRVARALRRMPLIRDAFAAGELSYSKVREITRECSSSPVPAPPPNPPARCQAGGPPKGSAGAQQAALRQEADRLRAAYDHIRDTRHPDARRISPVGGGEGFNLANCVDALFHITEPPPTPHSA